MSQSLAAVRIHIVFSTKFRTPLLTSEIQDEMHNYLAGIARDNLCEVFEIGGMPDHVHILLTLPRTITLAKLLENLKSGSSKWIRTKGIKHFAWQDGYGVFSVCESKIEAVRRYIRNQAIHHGKSSFQDEFRSFLTASHLPFDERYLWD